MTQSGRTRFISFLQILGVVLVILGHSLHEYPDNYYQLWFYRLFQTVRMPLFVFISGFLFMVSMIKKGDSMTFVGFAKNKTQRLLLPYYFLEVITFVPRSIMSRYADDDIELSGSSFFCIDTIFRQTHNSVPLVFTCYLHVAMYGFCRIEDL